MNAQNERRAKAFILTIANRCERCLHRSDANCRPCISAWANSIWCDIQAEAEGKKVDYSYGARMLRIVQILSEANKPLLASEIDIVGYCSRQLKYWTLKKMIKRGMILRQIAKTLGKRTFYGYLLNKAKKP